MPRTAEAKNERLQVRLDAQAKTLLRRAAGYRRKSVSQFVLSTALEEARRVVRENEIVTLTDPDWALFYDALIDPPPPNDALRRAFDRHAEGDE